jgi:hypothetical protein
MNKMTVVAAALFVVACGQSPAAPTPVPPPPPVAACVTNNTAEIAFGNRSNTITMDIILDGIKMMSISPIAPGATSSYLTVAASVAHTVQFRYTNLSTLACSTASPVFSQCSSQTMTCSGGQ